MYIHIQNIQMGEKPNYFIFSKKKKKEFPSLHNNKKGEKKREILKQQQNKFTHREMITVILDFAFPSGVLNNCEIFQT